jgi:hypothetical protein
MQLWRQPERTSLLSKRRKSVGERGEMVRIRPSIISGFGIGIARILLVLTAYFGIMTTA